jgi:hypothetical protein
MYIKQTLLLLFFPRLRGIKEVEYHRIQGTSAGGRRELLQIQMEII